jgi:zinc/manganese transport system ATP-binding protein
MVTPPAIRLDDVTLRYGGQDAVSAISGVFQPGSLTVLIGPNGAGKTTLLRALAGLHKPASGRIDNGGIRPAQVALLPQSSQLDRQFPITCGDVVALGLTAKRGAFQMIRKSERDAAADALATVGLPDFRSRPIRALSTGQFQRVLFARMMLQDASILLLDEPFSAVDAATEDDLVALLFSWHAEGRTIVIVLHDLELAAAFPQALLLAGRTIAWGPTDHVLTEANARRAGLIRDRRHLLRRQAA